MPTNLEIKAKLRSLKTAEKVAQRIGARQTEVLHQTDTYFDVREGRLKLREINRNQFELIYYKRGNVRGSRYSKYDVVQLSEPNTIKKICKTLFGEKVVVRKKRMLYLFRNSRIHLDRVQGLGTFIEFEVLVTRGKWQAQSLMRHLRKEFEIADGAIIAGSYSDLLFSKLR